MSYIDTGSVPPPEVQFRCALCKGVYVGPPGGHRGMADHFVWVRRMESYSDVAAPTHPTQCSSEDEVMKWFILEARCRRHSAWHQRPGVPLERGKVIAWKLLSEEKRRTIIAKGVFES